LADLPSRALRSRLLLSLLLPLAAWPLAAHDDEGGKELDRQDLTPSMRALLLDQQPPMDLAPMSLTPCVNGFAGIYPCLDVDLLSFLPLSSFGSSAGNSCWGWTDPLTGKEYALMGLNDGTGFVDITDPENPIYLGKLPTHTSSSTWRDIKVYSNHAYVVSEASGHGLQVFDLTQLRNVPNPPVTFSETAHYNQFGSSHTLALNEATGFAYACGSSTCSGGLHMVNVQNPTVPSFAGCYSGDGYSHETQCVIYQGPDTQHVGSEICFNSNEDTLTIVDVTNKSAPVMLSRTGYAGSGYTHQGWLTEDHAYFLIDDERDETNFGHNTRTWVFDVSNLDAPALAGWHDAAVPAIDHNLYVRGTRAYEANYRSGLRILEIDNAATAGLTEIAFFDIYPANDVPSFNGAWNNYPFFPSGTVIVSGMEQGLFVLRPPQVFQGFSITSNPTSASVCVPQDASYTLELAALSGYTGTQVTLSAGNLPAGVIADFAPNPVALPGSSTLTLDTSGATPPGEHTIDVTGVGNDPGATANAIQIKLIAATGPPTGLTLSAPANGALDQPTVLQFSWSAIPGETYRLQVDNSFDFSSPVLDVSGIGRGSYTNSGAPLPPARRWYWQVTPTNACGTGGGSATWSFTTIAEYVVDDTQPMNFVPGTTDIGNHCDDCTTPVALPFAAGFYGASFSSLNASSNGNLQFSSSSSAYLNACLPTSGFNNAVLAFWDDLLTSGAGAGIFTATVGSAPNRTFVVEYRNIDLFGGGNAGTWEVLFYEGQSRITVNYQTMVNPGSSATAGIQKDTGSQFLQYACNSGGLTSGKRVDYVLEIPAARIAAGPGSGSAGTGASLVRTIE